MDAFGHGHLGLTLAGMTGRLVVEIAGGHTLSKNINALRPHRFLIFNFQSIQRT